MRCLWVICMRRVSSFRLLLSLGSAVLVIGLLALNKDNLGQRLSFNVGDLSSPRAQAASSSFTDSSESLTDQGQNRTYYLHTPQSSLYARPLPLVVALHGSGMHGKEMAEKTALNRLADRANFIVAYPDALKKRWNVSGRTSEDNVGFVHHLIRQIQQVRPIDARKIYVVGLSSGGFLAQKLACENPAQIAAVATVAASLPQQSSLNCQKQHPVSLLMVNGTGDTVVPWQGGRIVPTQLGSEISVLPIPAAISFWRDHNGCELSGKVSQVSKLVKVTHYSACRAGSEIELAALQGAGHVWSGGGYGTSPYGDTTQRVWQFLEHHSKSH
jgi:polyhydroxybutyrate depolymerase